MKILVISDEECPALWDYYVPGRLDGYDLIISCGDLNPNYLSFIVTMAHCPVLYVHGNHDTSYSRTPPEGCDCIDGQYVVFNGVRIVGLGGCRKYHPGEHQYTEAQMRRRIRKLRFPLWRWGAPDIVVTHAPPKGLGDAEDAAHQGFEALRAFLDKYRPEYLLHGHVHLRYSQHQQRVRTYEGTTLINATERYELEIPDRSYPPEQRNCILWRTRHKEPARTGSDFY